MFLFTTTAPNGDRHSKFYQRHNTCMYILIVEKNVFFSISSMNDGVEGADNQNVIDFRPD